MKTWNDLSMAEKSEMIGVAVRNGITDLPTIRQKYNESAEGGKKDNLTPWKALENIDYIEVPDTAFTREKTGAGSIEVMFKDTPKEGYEYGTGYKYQHPMPGHNVVIYNPKDNDAQDIRLDALHIMPQDATYDALRSELAYYADNSDIANNARERMKDDIKQYGHLIPGMTYQDYYNNEIDGFLRNMFIEGSPEYISSKRYYPNQQQLREWNKELMPYVDRIHNYLLTGQRPANILPEVVITGNRRSIGGPLVEAAMNEYKHGGKIYIKPSHRGRLTELKKRTGKTEAELYRTGSPATRKMITFARNARKWKHELGGPLVDRATNSFKNGGEKSSFVQALEEQPEILADVQRFNQEQVKAKQERRERFRQTVEQRGKELADMALNNPEEFRKQQALRGAAQNAVWEKEHPNLTQWGYLAGAVPFAIATAPALEWAAGTSLGQGITGLASTAASSPVAQAAWPWVNTVLQSSMAVHGLQEARKGNISPTTVLELSPLAPAVVRTPGIINNLRPQNLRNHWYVSKSPIGYYGIGNAVERQIRGVLSGKPANTGNPWWFNNNNARQLQSYAYVPETVQGIEREEYLQQFGQHALRARTDAWRMHNLMPQKYNTFTPNPRHPGAYTDIEGIKNLKWIPPQVEGRPAVDFVNSVGGNVGIPQITRLGNGIPDKNVSLQRFGVSTTSDWFDLYPFSRPDDRLIPRLQQSWGKHIAAPLDRLGLYPQSDGLTYKVPSFSFLKNLDAKLAKLEAGQITGGKPFLVQYDIPWTQKVRFTDSAGSLGTTSEFLPGFQSENLLPQGVFDWRSGYHSPTFNYNIELPNLNNMTK